MQHKTGLSSRFLKPVETRSATLEPVSPTSIRVRGVDESFGPPPPAVFEARRAGGLVDATDAPTEWAAVDWRQTLKGVLVPFNEPDQTECVGFSVAVSVRAMLAIHRTDPGTLDPHHIQAEATGAEQGAFGSRETVLRQALSVVAARGVPGLHVRPQPHKIQSYVELDRMVDWMAWLRFVGPIVGDMKSAGTIKPMVVVGYIPEADDERFIVMDASNPHFGDGGFEHIALERARGIFVSGFGITLRELVGTTFEAHAGDVSVTLRLPG